MQRRSSSSSHLYEGSSIGVKPVACAPDLLKCETRYR